ncbi:lysozyme inhibitor LprI family protein [Achromobacter xylosoxidans]|uniref:lysozyme inhibitor LprI family protein n=1 Tax=Alcaligenes xylosoxydans xylosoxydans TaxID=85698 RepID=UPI001F146FEA|nr:lysozyme inhibitor LprI family protein [Achromobacter xylosoxidans]
MGFTNRAARLLCLAGLGALSAPAWAIDCHKAGTPAEKLICSDRGAVAADAELNRAYAALLKQAPDAQIRAMLVDSQRRWIEARNMRLEGLVSDPGSLPDEKTPGAVAADLIRSRASEFKERGKGDSLPRLIRVALSQREFRKQFTGGPYSGYETSCDVLPPDYKYYACFSTRHYQNNDRVCSTEEYWATGSVYVQRYVAKVVDNKPMPIASCSYNGNDASCPGSIDDDARWNTGPKVKAPTYSSKPLPQLDGEVDDSDDHAWIKACLTDSGFPLSNPTKAGG